MVLWLDLILVDLWGMMGVKRQREVGGVVGVVGREVGVWVVVWVVVGPCERRGVVGEGMLVRILTLITLGHIRRIRLFLRQRGCFLGGLVKNVNLFLFDHSVDYFFIIIGVT